MTLEEALSRIRLEGHMTPNLGLARCASFGFICFSKVSIDVNFCSRLPPPSGSTWASSRLQKCRAQAKDDQLKSHFLPEDLSSTKMIFVHISFS